MEVSEATELPARGHEGDPKPNAHKEKTLRKTIFDGD